jgi:hypothetical protein
MKREKKCCNGCDAPVQAPSKVLCKECLAKLDAKFEALAKGLKPVSKRQYVDRKVTLEDIGRELVKDEPLEVQIEMSLLIAKAKQAALQQKEQGAADGVIDFERGWRLV